jgi:hypothetical protein
VKWMGLPYTKEYENSKFIVGLCDISSDNIAIEVCIFIF